MTDLESLADDIRSMRVRGAGKIARHAARALAAWEAALPDAPDPARFEAGFRAAEKTLLETRPTAVSLANAVAFVARRVDAGSGVPAKRAALRGAAREFEERSRAAVDAIGRAGAALVENGKTYLTHCNSQAALAVYRAAHAEGKRFRVLATETRPWRQGLLTSRALAEAGIDVTLIVDSAVLSEMPGISGVFVGCDTLARNGDVVNKIGTSQVALAARERGVPFTVCAETYKVSPDAAAGADVPIEEREAGEIVDPSELPGVGIRNPVFDVTPAAWVTRVVTESGVVGPGEVARLAAKAWG